MESGCRDAQKKKISTLIGHLSKGIGFDGYA